jgi:LPS sulfotransferase NodH
MSQFDLKATLRQIGPPLRKQLLEDLPPLEDFDWAQDKKQNRVDALFDKLQELDNDQKRELNRLLRTCKTFSSTCGLKVLREELWQYDAELVDDWGKQKSRMNKVVWTYLNAPQVVEEAIVFVRADELSQRRHWHKWPAVTTSAFVADAERIAALKQEIIVHHADQFRGDQCEIHHYSRQNGAEYFFAYLPDWPDNFMVFKDDELEALDVPTAFSIMFVYTPATGVLEMIAAGGQKVQADLRQRFYRAMTKTEVDDMPPDRAAFDLNHVLEDGFSLTANDPQVALLQLKRLMVFPVTEVPVEGLVFRFRIGTTWASAMEQLDRALKSLDLDRSQVTVEEFVLYMQCVSEGDRRGRRQTIRVTPRACNLKSQDDDNLRVLGEQLLKHLGVDHD